MPANEQTITRSLMTALAALTYAARGGVELQDSVGRPLSSFGFADSDELFGDTLQRVVTWRSKSDVSAIAGRPIRVRIAMRDADIYSLKFQP